MLRRCMMVTTALGALHCGGGQSGTEDDSPYVESPFEVVTAAGEHLTYSDGQIHVMHRAASTALLEVSVTGRDATSATWGLVFFAEGAGLLGAYEARVTTGPTEVGTAAVVRSFEGEAGRVGEAIFATTGLARAEVVQGAAGLEMRGDVETPELAFSFEGPLLFSCSVPHELLPDAPPPPVPVGDTSPGPVLIGDSRLETEFCRSFMRSPRTATP